MIEYEYEYEYEHMVELAQAVYFPSEARELLDSIWLIDGCFRQLAGRKFLPSC